MENKKTLGRNLLLITTLFLSILAFSYIIGFETGKLVSLTSDLNIKVESGYCIHLIATVKRANGSVEVIKDGVALNNDAILTNIGKEFIEGKLGNPSFGNNTKFPVYISLSTTSETPSSSWVNIPDEITSGGLARAQGTYVSTGTGSWKITYTFTATSSFQGIKVVGLHWDSSGGANLFAVDNISSTNLDVNDQITLTLYVTVS